MFRRLSFRDPRHRQMGNTLPSSVVTTIERVLGRTEDAQCAAGLNCDRKGMEYTHDEYRDTPLTLVACNSRAGIDVWKPATCII
jgi:hypothetical protein